MSALQLPRRRAGCYDPAQLFKPQFAYGTPQGYRDEAYLIPFFFDNVNADGLVQSSFPWQLDDDLPFILHGILFPQIGTAQLPDAAFAQPGLCRITDTQGNPLSDGLVLALGVWCQSISVAGGVFYGFGFPIEPAIECAPGGVLLFDFQLSTNAIFATAFAVDGGGNGILLGANVFGAAGNAFTFQIVAGAALSVAVVGGAVTVTTNAGVSTYADVVAIINSTAAAYAVMFANTTGLPGAFAIATAIIPLAGGAASTPVTVHGLLIGEKRFEGCG